MAAVNKSLRADVKATSTSVQISRDTADAVDLDTHETENAPLRRWRPSMRLLLTLTLTLLLTSCAWLVRPTTARYVPPARCSERAIALRPPAPPNVAEWKPWAAAYVGAVGAYEDSENKRAHTAECLDEHRQK
ncbi:hypothetical protein SNK04_014275 [Fusarium graminearum]